MSETTPISVEFIIVECEYNELLNRLVARVLRFLKVKYRMFHVSAFAAYPPSSSTVKRKEKFWQINNVEINVNDITSPPNIFIIGQEWASRLNFRRHMTKPLKILESLGAVEMLGYTRELFYLQNEKDDN
jgi:hypothetical protein